MNPSFSITSMNSAAADDPHRRRKRATAHEQQPGFTPSSPPEPDSGFAHAGELAGSPPLPGSATSTTTSSSSSPSVARPAFLSSSLSRLTGVMGDADVDQLRMAIMSGFNLGPEGAAILSAISASSPTKTSPSPTPMVVTSKSSMAQSPMITSRRVRSSSGGSSGSSRLMQPHPSTLNGHHQHHAGFVPFPGDARQDQHHPHDQAHNRYGYHLHPHQQLAQHQVPQPHLYHPHQGIHQQGFHPRPSSSYLSSSMPHDSYRHVPSSAHHPSVVFPQPDIHGRRTNQLALSATSVPTCTSPSIYDAYPIRRAVSADGITASSIEEEDDQDEMWEEPRPQSKRRCTRVPPVQRIRFPPQESLRVSAASRDLPSPMSTPSPPASPTVSGKRSDIYGLLN